MAEPKKETVRIALPPRPEQPGSAPSIAKPADSHTGDTDPPAANNYPAAGRRNDRGHAHDFAPSADDHAGHFAASPTAAKAAGG